jgi:hypothetical protein
MTREQIEAVMGDLLDAAVKLQSLIADCQEIALKIDDTPPE